MSFFPSPPLLYSPSLPLSLLGERKTKKKKRRDGEDEISIWRANMTDTGILLRHQFPSVSPEREGGGDWVGVWFRAVDFWRPQSVEKQGGRKQKKNEEEKEILVLGGFRSWGWDEQSWLGLGLG
jgi:hypothetical protein